MVVNSNRAASVIQAGCSKGYGSEELDSYKIFLKELDERCVELFVEIPGLDDPKPSVPSVDIVQKRLDRLLESLEKLFEEYRVCWTPK